jgi:uncharacterized peroxidase-related enzyme
MTRIRPVEHESLAHNALLADVSGELGFIPVLMRLLAHSPAALGGFLALRDAVKRGALPAPLRERIAIAVATVNECDCCLANHTLFARGTGLAESELHAAAKGDSDEPQAAAALAFARDLVWTRGHVGDAALEALREVGFDEAAIVEIVAVVAVNIFANLVNNVARSAPDRCAGAGPANAVQPARDDLASDSSRSRL